MKQEMILAVGSSKLASLIRECCRNSFAYRTIDQIQSDKLIHLISPHLWLGPREVLETEVAFRQIIPYVIVMDKDDNILTYQRSKSQGDKRLNNLYSIGFGGHINLCDVNSTANSSSKLFDFRSILANAMRRELSEELNLPIGDVNKDQLSPLGYIFLGHQYGNTEDIDVNVVHFGLIYIWKTDSITIPTTNDDDLRNFQLVPMKDIRSKFDVFGNDNLEIWSTVAMELLEKSNVI